MRSLLLAVIIACALVAGAAGGYFYCDMRCENTQEGENIQEGEGNSVADTSQQDVADEENEEEAKVSDQHGSTTDIVEETGLPRTALFIEKNDELFKVDPFTGQKESIGTGTGASMSPDGTTLAFVRGIYTDSDDAESETGVYLYDVATGTTTQIRSYSADNDADAYLQVLTEASWSPDGTYLLLDSGTGAVRTKTVMFSETGHERLQFQTYGTTWTWIDDDTIAYSQLEQLDQERPWDSGNGTGVSIQDVWGEPRVLRSPTATEEFRVVDTVRDGILFEVVSVESIEDWNDNDAMKSFNYVYNLTTEEVTDGDGYYPPAYGVMRKLPETYDGYQILDIDVLNSDRMWYAFVLNEKGETRADDKVFIMNMEDPESIQSLGDGTHPAW